MKMKSLILLIETENKKLLRLRLKKIFNYMELQTTKLGLWMLMVTLFGEL